MGLFGAIKNAIGEQTFRMQETAEERMAAIVRMKQIPEVSKNHMLSRILDECGGMENLYIGNGSYEKEELVSKFRLPDDEVIILYVSWGQGLIGVAEPRFLVTDRAVYYIQLSGNDVIRLDFFSTTQYILVYSFNEKKVRLVNENEDCVICAKGFIKKHLSKSDEAFVINKILALVQEETIAYDKNTKSNRSALFHWIYGRVNDNLRTAGIRKSDEELLNSLKCDKEYKELCSLMLLKGYLYANNLAYFDATLREMEEPAEEKQEVLNKFDEVISRYLTELKDSSVDFSGMCLETADLYSDRQSGIFDDGWDYSEFQKSMIEIYNKYAIDISYYLIIRKEPQIPILEIMNICSERGISEEKRTEYIFASLIWHNKSMKSIWEIVESGQNPDGWQLLWKDSMGFTALHYAMLLGKRAVAEFCISNMPDFEKEYIDRDYGMIDARFYGIAAVLTGMDDLLISLSEKTEEIAPLLKVKRTLLRSINICSKTRQVALTTARMAEKNIRTANMNGDSDSADQLAAKLDKLIEQIEFADERIEELAEQLKDVDYDIEIISRIFVERYRELAVEIENSDNPIERYFFCIYSNPQLLKTLLEYEPEKFQIFDYCGQFVLLSPHIGNFEFGDHNASEFASFEYKENHDTFQKPYGTNWFSPEAHKDLHVMRKEYHKLAAKYHPDCNPNAIETFLDIQAERADVLETLSKD